MGGGPFIEISLIDGIVNRGTSMDIFQDPVLKKIV
jgi:hypothetical protein